MLKHFLQNEKGSVMLEFCLVLPIYLLIFGGTFLIFDITMGKLHLAESNRNLAWICDDRYNDSKNLINKELYRRATAFYDNRNALEKQWEPAENFWSFSSQDPDKLANSEADDENFDRYKWADGIGKFKDDSVSLDAKNDFLKLYSGNMGLRMDKVSAVYIGAVAVSSVIFPVEDQSGNETVPLYKAAYDFTRVTEEKDEQLIPSKQNGEMLIVRRTGTDTRENVKTVNDVLFNGKIMFRSWAHSDNIIDNIKTLLGI